MLISIGVEGSPGVTVYCVSEVLRSPHIMKAASARLMNEDVQTFVFVGIHASRNSAIGIFDRDRGLLLYQAG